MWNCVHPRRVRSGAAVLFVSLMLTTGLIAQSAPEETASSAAAVDRRQAPEKFRVAAEAQTQNSIPKFDTGGTLTDSVMYESSGNIGLGTAAPTAKLHLYATAGGDMFMGMGPDPSGATGPAMNVGYAGYSYGRGAGFFNVRPDALATAPNPSLRFMTVNVIRMTITNTGAVGIGALPDSTTKLHVEGNIKATGSITGATVLGAVYQDMAEWVPASSDMTPGTVVVLNRERTNEVMPSSRGYDTTVAGVVSAAPGIILGVAGDAKEQIATTGRVKVRVDARQAPVHVGDLLVTSDLPGTAMRSEPMNINGRQFHQPGTIIGKALEPLREGVGEILVLLSMQ